MRKLTLVALLLIFTISGAAFAQQAVPVFCGTLSEADCAILTQSQTAMASLHSASFGLQVDVSVTDIPDMSQPFTLSMTGSGAYAGLGAMSSALLENTGDPAAMLSSLLSDLQFDGTITFNLSPEIARMANIPASITIEGRLVDGFGYLNLDTLRDLMGRSSNLRGWYGLDLAGLLNAAMAQMPDMFGGSMGGMSAVQDYEQALMNPDFYNRFMSIERTDNGSGDSATFAINVNMAAMMTSPEFTDLLKTQMQAQGQTLSEKEMGQAMAMASQMFKGMSITISEEIGLSDGYMRTVSGNFSFDTTGMMRAIDSMSNSKAASAAPRISVDFSYSTSDFNDAPAITAPENPTIIPYQSLISRSASA